MYMYRHSEKESKWCGLLMLSLINSSTLHSYEFQSGNGTIFYHHLLVLLVVQKLILCVFSEEKVRVTRKYMAPLMTSLKRDGFSLTLLKASPFWEECLGK